MKRKRQTRSLPPFLTSATLAADTADAEARTVEATIYSGAKVARFPLFDDPHYLELAVSEKAVDLGRINRGVAPLLDSHSHAGVGAVLGRVEQARIEAGEVRARLRFSRRPEVDGVWQDVVDGILGAVSVGVVLHEVEEAPRKKGSKAPDADMRTFKATRWEINEVSVVPVGADPAARIEAADEERHPCRVTLMGGENMRFKKCPECKAQLKKRGDGEELTECPECQADLAELVAERDEQRRVAKLGEIARFYETGELLLAKAIRDRCTPDDFQEQAAAERARRQGPMHPNVLPYGGTGDPRNEPPDVHLSAMAENLAMRALGKELEGPAQRFGDLSLPEAALQCLSLRGQRWGLSERDLRSYGGRRRVVELALHTTSDFPQILGNTIHRLLLPMYESAQPTYRLVAQRRPFNDFRTHSVVRAGDFPAPLAKGEHGEYQYGTMGENAETAVLVSYGRIFGITREAIVNDDLGAFSDLAQKAAVRTVDFLNARFFELLIAPNAALGPDMSDTNPVYDSTAHANEAAAGALDVTRLGSARELMMNQTSIDGLKLNVSGRYLLVSPASLTLAEQLATTINPSTVSEANPFQARITPLGDANLSGTRFYVLSDPMRGSNYFYGGLGGQEGPRVDVREGWEVDGVEVRLAIDQGFGVQDFRFGVTGAGS